LATEGAAETSSSSTKLSKGDIALLQFALWAEIVESCQLTSSQLGAQREAAGKPISKTGERQIRPDMNYISLQNFSESNRFCLCPFEQNPHRIE
jgi:hypothetical protein